MSTTIRSTWEWETARWDGERFVDRKVREEFKDIKMWLDSDDGETLLSFGGPTGFEVYNVRHLKLEHNTDFCICGGTVNSWPRCTVDADAVRRFLKSEGYAHETH